MTVKVDRELALQAMLVEYETLRTEIQNRSELQNRFIQLHLTAISIVIGLLLQDGFWIYPGFIVVIALTSSVFGLWWIDQAVTINRIGCHLADPIEQNVNALVGSDVMQWESEERNPLLRKFSEAEMQRRFKDLVMLTYVLPAIAAFLLALSVVGLDICRNRESVFSFARLDVWIVVLLIPFVAAILLRLWGARSWLIEVGDYAAHYKRRLRDEPIDEEHRHELSRLDGEGRWKSRQNRIQQELRTSSSSRRTSTDSTLTVI